MLGSWVGRRRFRARGRMSPAHLQCDSHDAQSNGSEAQLVRRLAPPGCGEELEWVEKMVAEGNLCLRRPAGSEPQANQCQAHYAKEPAPLFRGCHHRTVGEDQREC